jgi:hypothetical protein
MLVLLETMWWVVVGYPPTIGNHAQSIALGTLFAPTPYPNWCCDEQICSLPSPYIPNDWMNTHVKKTCQSLQCKLKAINSRAPITWDSWIPYKNTVLRSLLLRSISTLTKGFSPTYSLSLLRLAGKRRNTAVHLREKSVITMI